MAGEAAKGTMGIFVIFVLSRALHPMVIDYSKVDGKMLYSKNSPAIMSQVFSMLFVNFLAWQEEGMKGVKACWEIPKGASIFIVIGLWYAFGDFLEMLSMGAMTGGVYQLLLQSKLLITAVMMMYLKGTMQSALVPPMFKAFLGSHCCHWKTPRVIGLLLLYLLLVAVGCWCHLVSFVSCRHESHALITSIITHLLKCLIEPIPTQSRPSNPVTHCLKSLIKPYLNHI